MSAILKNFTYNFTSNPEIQLSPSWLGKVSGLVAEKMLRGLNRPYLYVLRAGETEMDYYITYVHADGSVRHQPFVVTLTEQGWCCENGGPCGPFVHETIDDVVHQMIYCKKEECTPLINFKKS